MDIKLKNRKICIIIFMLSLIVVSLSIVLFTDVVNHKSYLSKDPYFTSDKFKKKVNNFFSDVLPSMDSSQFVTSRSNKESIIENSYVKTIEVGKNNKKTTIINLINNYKSFEFYIKVKSTGEVFTNISNYGDIEKYYKQKHLYSIKFPSYSKVDKYYSSINDYFISLGAQAYIMVPYEKSKNDIGIYNDYLFCNSVKNRVIKEGLIGIVALILGCMALVLALKSDACLTKYIRQILKKIPIDIRAAIMITSFLVALAYMNAVNVFYYPIDEIHVKRLCFVISLFIVVILIVIDFLHLKNDIAEFKHEIENSFIKLTYKVWKDSYFNKTDIILMIILIWYSFLVGASVLDGEMLNKYSRHMFLFTLIIIYFLIVPLYAIKRMHMLNNIMKATKKMADGEFEYSIDELGNDKLSKLAANINNVRDGLKNSLENQMKSERLKAELITNVSHDLKTPLTAIINYVDLLKRDNLTPEENKNYLDVLDKKSKRLKVLIEDLFDISKISSGAVELNIEKIDVCSLLTQTLGELDEKITASSLSFKVNVPEEKIMSELDGRKTWRVFDNLINNALKYSLPDTRVYVDVKRFADKVTIVFKNVSNYEMNFDPNEIFERFKRGDKSRNTEGSGLGLAIAKSIVELENGKLLIDIDGDLFKATVEFECCLDK